MKSADLVILCYYVH